MTTNPAAIDHLVYAAPTLSDGIRSIREILGVEPTPGGRHPTWGTRNALVGLAGRTYLEIIGPDPEKADDPGPPLRPFGIDLLTAPRLAAWAVRSTALEACVAAARSAGFEPGDVISGRRDTPAGSTLTWRLTDPLTDREGGAFPFFIDWDSSHHPSEALSQPCSLRELRVAHPEPSRLRTMLHAVGLAVRVEPAPEPGISAVVDTPRGPRLLV